MANESRMRRAPQQARGQRRVTQILDAASQVFAEIGYDAATTNAIAIRANTSIGSLYQFFPNKLAILDALATRYRMQLDTLLEGIFANESAPLQSLLETTIDKIAEFYAANPGFQAMFYTSQSSKALSAVSDDICRIVTKHVNRRFSSAVPKLEPDVCEFYATVVVFIIRSLIPMGAAQRDERERMLIAQLKRIIIAYLKSIEHFRDQQFALTD